VLSHILILPHGSSRLTKGQADPDSAMSFRWTHSVNCM